MIDNNERLTRYSCTLAITTKKLRQWHFLTYEYVIKPRKNVSKNSLVAISKTGRRKSKLLLYYDIWKKTKEARLYWEQSTIRKLETDSVASTSVASSSITSVITFVSTTTAALDLSNFLKENLNDLDSLARCVIDNIDVSICFNNYQNQIQKLKHEFPFKKRKMKNGIPIELSWVISNYDQLDHILFFNHFISYSRRHIVRRFKKIAGDYIEDREKRQKLILDYENWRNTAEARFYWE
ncbi:hypothetical protein BDF21DRAFT_456014 [Thamnidium elegans]|nr:hypothetical protein BDF21DRAFT_456014 [Thamnidium elegans]